jgi:hypothetical protein
VNSKLARSAASRFEKPRGRASRTPLRDTVLAPEDVARIRAAADAADAQTAEIGEPVDELFKVG